MVFFLGAGASAPFGYPITSDLLPRIWKGLHTANGSDSWTRWAGMNGHGDANRLLALLTSVLPGLKGAQEFDGGASIIDIISIVDQLAMEGQSSGPNMNQRAMLEARQVLTKAVNGVLQGKKQLHLAARFADWLIRAGTEQPDRRVTVISTNYDTTFERALFKRLLNHGVSIGDVVDFGMPWRDAFRSHLHLRPVEARLCLLKLHGSLNWLRCEVCGHVTMNVQQRIATLENWSVRSPRGYNVCHCDGQLRSILVTPSVVRDVRDANLLGIWNAALEELRSADEWTFIGYSLPSEDIAIRSVLLRAWQSRERERLRVRVIQREPAGCRTETQKRYRLFFPSTALSAAAYVTDGVEPFIEGLELLTEAQLTQRIHNILGGYSPGKLKERERNQAARRAEGKTARAVARQQPKRTSRRR